MNYLTSTTHRLPDGRFSWHVLRYETARKAALVTEGIEPTREKATARGRRVAVMLNNKALGE